MVDLRRGDIFLYSGKGLIAWFIKQITKSRWSHCGWMTTSSSVVEANDDGIEISKEFPYRLSRCAFIRLKVKPEDIEQCVKFAESKIGRPYDYKLFLGLLWRWIFGWKRKKDIGDWPNGYVCSELVAMPVMMSTGIIFAENVHPGNTVPADIWKYANEHPEKAEIIFVGSKVK